MNKKGLFGINLFLIVMAFVLGILAGGYFVAKANGALDKVTGFFTHDSESLTDSLNTEDNAQDSQVSEELVFDGLSSDGNETNQSLG